MDPEPEIEVITTRDVINRLFVRIDTLSGDVAHVREVSAAILVQSQKTNGSLDDHMRRIEALEVSQSAIKTRDDADKAWDDRMRPLRNTLLGIWIGATIALILVHSEEMLKHWHF